MPIIIAENLKQNIRNYYINNKISISKLSEKFNISYPTIIKILKDIPKYSKISIQNPNLDNNIFENIDNEYKAYFIGLLIADGNIFVDNKSNRQASISLTLLKEDSYILQLFKQITKTTTCITTDYRKKQPICSIAIRSNKIAKDLNKFGIVPRKTFKTYLPILKDSSLMRHLIRGILDGDGSIFYKQTKRRFLHSISFCGTYQLMLDLSNYLFNELNLTIYPKIYSYKNRQLSEIKIQNKLDIKTLGDWLYNNSNIYLKRKKEKYNNIIKHYYDNTEVNL